MKLTAAFLLTLLIAAPTAAPASSPQCADIGRQVTYLAHVMVDARDRALEIGCETGGDPRCIAHATVFLRAQKIGRQLAALYRDLCREA